jgi:hypothetical protein
MRLVAAGGFMSRSMVRMWPLLLVAVLFAMPASAEVFRVTLTNGTVLETAYQPQQASWDPNMVLLLTEVGNWVGFQKDEIDTIKAEDPTQGFGIRISDKTIALGQSPNDLPEADATGKDQLADRALSLAERQLELAEKQQNYSVQQFVEPGQTQGIPIGAAGTGTAAPVIPQSGPAPSSSSSSDSNDGNNGNNG